MAEIPKTLMGYNVFVDGTGYAGRVIKGTPPKLTKALLEHRAGIPAPIQLFRGFEAMDCEFTLREFKPRGRPPDAGDRHDR